MKTQLSLFTLLFLIAQLSFGQKIKTPKDLNEAIIQLQKECPQSLKSIIKKTSNDSLINLCYPWNGDYRTIFDWIDNDNKDSKIRNYLISNGISSNEYQQTVILIAFKKTLLGEPFTENSIFRPYKEIEAKWAREDSLRFTTDSLRGVYIPNNLEDCFAQINSFWSDSTKTNVKKWTESEFSGKAHFGFGMWMRNNWQLWGGSRLSKYFNEMGVYHPDDMSGIILTSYHRYLTGKDIKLAEQIKYYQDFWKKSKEENKKN